MNGKLVYLRHGYNDTAQSRSTYVSIGVILDKVKNEHKGAVEDFYLMDLYIQCDSRDQYKYIGTDLIHPIKIAGMVGIDRNISFIVSAIKYNYENKK